MDPGKWRDGEKMDINEASTGDETHPVISDL